MGRRYRKLLAGAGITVLAAVALQAGVDGRTIGQLGSILLSPEFGAAALIAALPLLLAALGGLLSEVSGTLNLALEAMMLCGALAAYLGALDGGSPWIGLLAAMAAGALIGLLHGVFSITLRGNQIVSAVALNLFAMALTSYIFRVFYGKTAVLPFSTPLPQFGLPLLRDLPYLGPVLFRQNVLMYAGILLVPAIWFVLYRTGWGLMLRAAGEHPLAAHTVGIRVRRVRYAALLSGGALAGAGGAALVSASGINMFQENMSAGRGFIAFAAILFGRWRPFGVLTGALLFGVGDALQIRLQAYSVPVPHQLLFMLPYLITLAALVLFIPEASGPAASGVPFEAETPELKLRPNTPTGDAQETKGELLELRRIVKQFGELKANDQVSLTLRGGEIHAILGENGAGKTTLMNVIYGLYQPDGGQILLRGRPVRISSPREAMRLGIGMVHQHSMLIPAFSALENITLGTRPAHPPLLNLRRTARDIEDVWRDLDPGAAPTEKVGRLTVGQRQKVEIIRALSRRARILILDEPTALLTPQETEQFLALLRQLRDSGATIVLVSHKLKEVLAVSDRITIMRAGRVVRTLETARASAMELAELMVGRELSFEITKAPASPGDALLEVRDVHSQGATRARALHGFSLDLLAGEIHGLAGVEGNGQSELMEVLLGLRPIEEGHLLLRGEEINTLPTDQRLRRGLAVVPEDRHEQGLVLKMTIAENLLLDTFSWEPYARRGWMRSAPSRARAATLMQTFQIRAPRAGVPVRNLSGGNQQKVVLARALGRRPHVLLVAHPTRGLDVGAAADIHARIIVAREAGAAVLLISSELEEIMALSDRISVIYEGRNVETTPAAKTSLARLGLLMAGGHPGENSSSAELAVMTKERRSDTFA